jgi:DnaJ-class molecular chaperone
MRCDTCGGRGIVKLDTPIKGLYMPVPCPDCINGEVSCCDGSPRDLAKGDDNR